MNYYLQIGKRYVTQPVIADMLHQRALGWTMLGAVGIQAGLIYMDLPGWPCPFRHYLGIPCLGCGLSRAAVALSQGDWETAMTYHAFVLPVLLGLALIIIASLLPERNRQQLITYVKGAEQRLGVSCLLLMGMVLYWLGRMILFHDTYFALIMN